MKSDLFKMGFSPFVYHLAEDSKIGPNLGTCQAGERTTWERVIPIVMVQVLTPNVNFPLCMRGKMDRKKYFQPAQNTKPRQLKILFVGNSLLGLKKIQGYTKSSITWTKVNLLKSIIGMKKGMELPLQHVIGK